MREAECWGEGPAFGGRRGRVRGVRGALGCAERLMLQALPLSHLVSVAVALRKLVVCSELRHRGDTAGGQLMLRACVG